MSVQPREPVTFSRFRFSEPVPAQGTPQVAAIQIGLHQQSVSDDQAYWWPGDTQHKSNSGYVPQVIDGVSTVDQSLQAPAPPPPAPPPPSSNVNVNNVWIAYQLASTPGTWFTTKSWQAPESPGGSSGAPTFYFTEVQVAYSGGSWSVTLQAQTAS